MLGLEFSVAEVSGLRVTKSSAFDADYPSKG